MIHHVSQNEDMVSVVIPYCEKYTPRSKLEEAIESVKRQSVETELIVVEDEEPRGVSQARNRGLDRASARYVAFLDADDIWAEDKLERQMNAIYQSGSGLCVEGEYESTEMFIQAVIDGEVEAVTSSILIDTEVVDATFRERLERLEDWVFLMEAAVQGGACFVDDVMTVRKHDDGLSAHSTAEMHYDARIRMAEIIETCNEIKHLAPRVRRQAHYGIGFRYQRRGEYQRAGQEMLKALRHEFALKPLIMLILIPILFVKSQLVNILS